jgi:hypothetical protein
MTVRLDVNAMGVDVRHCYPLAHPVCGSCRCFNFAPHKKSRGVRGFHYRRNSIRL